MFLLDGELGRRGAEDPVGRTLKQVRRTQLDESLRPAPNRKVRSNSTRTLVLLLGGFLAIIVWRATAMDSGSPVEVRELSLGQSGTTDQGSTVKVDTWMAESSSDAERSEIIVESCRTSRDQPIISAGAFALEMPGGKSLEPNGSELTVVGENCIKGNIFFPATDGKPRSVVLNKGQVKLSWTVDEG
jgi:hypothetical protein